MTGMSTRVVSFGGSSVQIEHAGKRAAEIVQFLCAGVRADRDPAPHTTFRVQEDPDGCLTVCREREFCYRGADAALAARVLMEATCASLAARCSGGLLFHAAAVEWRGKGMLLPGKTGAGKSILTAWLSARGFGYLTDELVYLPQGLPAIQAIPRPVHVKKSGRDVLQRLHSDGWSWLTSDLVTMFRPTALERPVAAVDLAAVVFPQYRGAGPFRFGPLSAAQAGLQLMECLLNARNLPDHGFPAVADLARRVPTYALTYTDFDELQSWAHALTESMGEAGTSRGRKIRKISEVGTGSLRDPATPKARTHGS